MKFVDRPEFGSVLAQLDIEASLKGKFHSNPPSGFRGDAIARKIKDADDGHVFGQIGFVLILAQLETEGNILIKI